MSRRLLILCIISIPAIGAVSEPAAAQVDLPFSSRQTPDGSSSPVDALIDRRPARPEQLLARAVSALEASHSISAAIQCQIDLFDSRWTGQGGYWEQRSGPLPLMRLELQIPFQKKTGRMLQVCDGRWLWTYEKLLRDPNLSRVDVEKVAAAMEEGRGRTTLAGTEMLVGLGGLPRLLRGLAANFDFTSAEAGRISGLPVWQLRGCWKEKGPAEHLPDQVLLVLGQSDLFPYRIDYLQTGRKRPLVAMSLSDVKLNVPIQPDRFTYRPPDGLKPVDRTETIVEKLREQ